MKREKIRKDLGKPHKSSLKDMYNLQEIFRERDNILKGLQGNEIISLFYNIPIEKVLKLPREKRFLKWLHINHVKRWLIKSQNMAIIYKNVPRGTELYDSEFGKRILSRRSNVFYRCLNMEDALGYRNKMDKIGKSFIFQGNQVVKTTLKEQKRTKEKEILNEINKQ